MTWVMAALITGGWIMWALHAAVLQQRIRGLERRNRALLEAVEAGRRCERTRVWNRAAWGNEARPLLEECPDPAVLFVDLDQFKQVNDTWGHSAGDAVLAVQAERITATLGPAAVVGRFAGDEFVAALPELADPSVLDRLVEALAEPIQLADGGWLAPSASIGVAEVSQIRRVTRTQPSLPQWVGAADAALYQAKLLRGRWVRYEPWMRTAQVPRQQTPPSVPTGADQRSPHGDAGANGLRPELSSPPARRCPRTRPLLGPVVRDQG
ncbi:GGDEF domain-containing protein [Actinoalloteichus caeruleus]|uniref:GGDEF domain-containing protein n=1 Tax=Actinoalloteichus cyanogriseus TaxID=2893586 RepID=UPI003BB98BC3